jgi:hypothetical protein
MISYKPVFRAAIATVLLLCSHSEASASSPDMTCKEKENPAQTAAVCRIRPLSETETEITCLPTINAGVAHLTYVCSYRVRDWAQPSPYAHTSQVWTCTAGEVRVYLFDQDFYADAIRCSALCGRCDAGWQPAKSVP